MESFILVIIYSVSKLSSLFSDCSLFSASCLGLADVIFLLISRMIFLRVVLSEFLLQPAWSVSFEFLLSDCFGPCLLCNQLSSDVRDLDCLFVFKNESLQSRPKSPCMGVEGVCAWHVSQGRLGWKWPLCWGVGPQHCHL